MQQFVLVRLVRAENLDLSLFQFDPDLSFAVFFLNADKTVYGRFGSRSDFFDAEREITLEGLKKAMQSALMWHEDFAQTKALFANKRQPAPLYPTLNDFPSSRTGRRGRGGRGGRGGGGGRCTHCHDLRTAEQMEYRQKGHPIPESVIFSWPMPDAPGLRLDPKEMATVEKVWAGSPAEEAGFKAGDQIVHFDEQPILSIADVQWVLQNAEERDTLTADVQRNGKRISLDLELEPGWRRFHDISWRRTTEILRSRILGGIEYRDIHPEERELQGLNKKQVALRAARGVSRSTGLIRRDDIIVAVDGNSEYKSEGDLLAYFAQHKKTGDTVHFKILRGKDQIEIDVPVE